MARRRAETKSRRRQPLLGDPGPGDKDHLIPIEVDGQVVGWLGLKRHEPFKSGPPADLLRRQTRQLYMLGGIVIAMTALIRVYTDEHYQVIQDVH